MSSSSVGGHRAGKRAGAHGVQGEAERAGSVQPGEEKVKGRPYRCLQPSDHRV